MVRSWTLRCTIFPLASKLRDEINLMLYLKSWLGLGIGSFTSKGFKDTVTVELVAHVLDKLTHKYVP